MGRSSDRRATDRKERYVRRAFPRRSPPVRVLYSEHPERRHDEDPPDPSPGGVREPGPPRVLAGPARQSPPGAPARRSRDAPWRRPRTVHDVLFHRPRRYEPAAPEVAISDLFGEDEVAISGRVVSASLRRLRGRLTAVDARIKDATGTIGVRWFNQPWLADKLAPGTQVRVRGHLSRYGFQVRSYDLGDAEATADFAPVYPASEEVPVKRLRELVRAALPAARDVPDPLPAALREREGLPLKADALAALHFPRDVEEGERARRRLAFDELLVLQLGILRRKAEAETEVATALGPPAALVARYRDALPFTLTEHQER